MRVLDSDILIDLLRGHLPAVQWFAGLTEIPGVPGFAVLELIAGFQSKEQVRWVYELIKGMIIYWPTEIECQRALDEFASRHLSHRLGVLDALIAACALSLEATLCTFNQRHFQSIPGLVTERPYSR
jgi:predicted nucleic acid-binding protein